MNLRPQPDVTRARRRSPARMLGLLLAILVLLSSGLVVGAPATARHGTSDVVRAWNSHAFAALTNAPTAPVPGAGQTPPVSQLHLAMVQLAVHDAVNSIVGTHESYLAGFPEFPATASLDAAVATAAHDVLAGLGIAPVPALPQVVLDRLTTLYAETLALIPDGSSKDDGIAAGAAAAAAILAARTGDGRYVPYTHAVGTDPGEWRPTPPAFVNDPFAWVAKVRPFTLDSSSQFRTNGPRPLDSRAYAREYNEVKALGSDTVGSRTPEQQAIADFFQVSPSELFNRGFRTITADKGLGIAHEARLFAMINVAAADATIHCWDEKTFWLFWRPITAIQNGDTDGNDRTAGDENWNSLIPSPPYPDHTSGYNCATASLMHAAQRFFGRANMDLSFTNLVTGVTRTYDHFSDVYADTIEARILQGIHFRSADVQGARLGRQVANWVARHYFRPA